MLSSSYASVDTGLTGLSTNARGALILTLTMAGFQFNNSLMKLAGAQGVGVFEAVLVRDTVVVVGLTIIAAVRGELRPMGRRDFTMVSLRASVETVAVFSFLTALFHMQQANAVAILNALPIVVIAGAAVAFGESVGPRTWAVVFLGFVGVLIVLRPSSDGFEAPALLALAATIFGAARDLLAKHVVDKALPATLLALASALLVCVVAGSTLLLLGEWRPLKPLELSYLVLAGLCMSVSYLGNVVALRLGDSSFVQPFGFSRLLWATFFGFFFFGEVPDLVSLAGAAIVVGCGLYVILDERHRASSEPTQPSMMRKVASGRQLY